MATKIDFIDVKIPYEIGGRLAYAYNRAMDSAKSEWVLLLDHDLFACNNQWYQICLEAIKQAPPKTGWISAVTNKIGNPCQKAENSPVGENLVEHIKFAKQLYKEHGNKLVSGKALLSGFFILTNKTAWKDIGGFPDKRKGILGVDNDYCRALKRAGYKTFIMPGLYYYHLWRLKKLLNKE